MTKKVEEYRNQLRSLDRDRIEAFLREQSGLPGARANLELAYAFAEVGSESMIRRFLEFGPDQAPADSPDEFLAFCGVVGLGRLVTEGEREHMSDLRTFASDPRWRIREAVAMALQQVGENDMNYLLERMEDWSQGGPLERRAAAAALCEPKLLTDDDHARQVLDILDAITASIQETEDRRREEFRALRKGLGYCWSVAVVASPEYGKQRMDRWLDTDDPDIQWIMRENLKKSRLTKLDPNWVEEAKRRATSDR